MASSPLSPELKDYRKDQLSKATSGQNDYDKLAVALSGGALGLSFTFLKDLANGQASSHVWLLLWAWGCWGLSLTFTLISIYTGVEALRETVRQVDDGTLYDRRPGGRFDWFTAVLNPGAGVLFILGLVFMILFVYFNPYGKKNPGTETRPPATTQTETMNNPAIVVTNVNQRIPSGSAAPPEGPRPDDPPPKGICRCHCPCSSAKHQR